jgi:DNA polymerase I
VKRIVFDIECDGLLDTCSVLHSLVCMDADTGEIRSFADQEGYESLAKGLELLSQAKTLVGHNIIAFDIPALQKICQFVNKAKVYDTLTAVRTAVPDIMMFDAVVQKIPTKLWGRHGLKAWGYRLDQYKGDYGEQEDAWAEWSKDMQDYCEQDVRVTYSLYKFLQEENLPREALAVEHKLAHYLFAQERNGFPFKVKEAEELNLLLEKEEKRLLVELQGYFGKFVKRGDIVIPKVNRGRIGDKKSTLFKVAKGCSYCKLEIKDYTGGPVQTKAALKRVYGWEPDIVKKRKRVRDVMENVEEEEGTDEATLSRLDFPAIPTLIEYNGAKKVRGMLSQGNNAWLRLVDEYGFIHGRVNQNGTVTHRATHSKPNISQVPSEKRPYGKEARNLFHAPQGWKLIGADASGLELRMLAHYMHPFDGGAYAKEILSGDIHTANQMAAGLSTRNDAKTFIYAFLYGAGAAKLGLITDPQGSEFARIRQGKQLKERFLENTPALKQLIQTVSEDAERGFVYSIDGRKTYVKSPHKALNCLLQSSGSIVVKKWITLFYDKFLEELGEPSWRGNWSPCSYSHDDAVVAVREEYVDRAKDIMLKSIVMAGKLMKCDIQIDGEAKVGQTWYDVH